jgi:hypothetical protein
MRLSKGKRQWTGPWADSRGLSVRRQLGAATLAMAVIMLLVVSVLLFHSHTAGWLEQRATSNQARAKQAHATAEAGLDVALAVLNADSGAPSRTTYLSTSATEAGKFSINPAPLALTGTPATGLSYSVTYSLVSPDTAPADRFLLTSSGGSDCTDVNTLGTCSGQARVNQVVRLTPILLNPPTAAITSAANFNSLFGAPQAAIKALTSPVTSGASLGASTSGLVWHEGNLILSGPVGSDVSPVLLVVEGDLTISAGTDIRGFVFVTGNVTCAGCSTPSIRGAIGVVGTHSLTTVEVQFPVDTVNGPMARVRTTAPRFARVMGTWRDWE